jgi:hypothetical protein
MLITLTLLWILKQHNSIQGDVAELMYLRDSLTSGLGQLIECTDQQIIDLVMQGTQKYVQRFY